MTARWIAAGTRARGLASRRILRPGAARVAACPDLAGAVRLLADSPYGRRVRVGQTLPDALHGVTATLVWHLRVLAGWSPVGRLDRVRELAAGLDVARVAATLDVLAGTPARAGYDLGALRGVRLETVGSIAELRAALARSPWGDPGSDDPAQIRLCLRLAWARRVLDGVPEAARWAESGAALTAARALSAGVAPAPTEAARRDLHRLLGPRLVAAHRLVEQGELWRAETRWWGLVDSEAEGLLATRMPGPATVVGAAALLAADAWFARAALQLAARGGGSLEAELGAVA